MVDQTHVRRPHRSLVSGSMLVAAGLAVFGLSTYVFTALTTRALGPDGFGEFSVFWSTLYGVGLGVALPIEQETSRRVAEARHRGQSGVAAMRRMIRPTLAVMSAAALAACGVLALVTEDKDGLPWLWGTVVFAFAGLAGAYLTRGAFSGRRRYGRYSAQLVVEGLARLVFVAGLTMAAVAHPAPYAAAVGTSLIVATGATVLPRASTLRRHAWRPDRSGPVTRTTEAVVPGLLAMTVASVAAQSLVNFGPIVVRLLDPTATAAAGAFLAAALIARTPTFAFAAVQAVLIPRLVETLGRRDVAGYRYTLRLVLSAVAVLSLAGIIVCALVGPELLALFTGPGFSLPRVDIVLLAVSTGLYLVTLTLQPAAIALRRHSMTAWAWSSAALLFMLMCFIPGDPVRVTNLAMCGALGAASVALWITIQGGLRAHASSGRDPSPTLGSRRSPRESE